MINGEPGEVIDNDLPIADWSSNLGGGARVGKQVNFTEVVGESDHLPVVRSDQSIDVGAI